MCSKQRFDPEKGKAKALARVHPAGAISVLQPPLLPLLQLLKKASDVDNTLIGLREAVNSAFT